MFKRPIPPLGLDTWVNSGHCFLCSIWCLCNTFLVCQLIPFSSIIGQSRTWKPYELQETAKLLIAWIVILLLRLILRIFVAWLNYSSWYFFLTSFLFTSLDLSIPRYLYWSLMSRAFIVSLLEKVVSCDGVNFPFSMLRIMHLSSPKFILMSLLNFKAISRRFHICLILLVCNLVSSIKRR